MMERKEFEELLQKKNVVEVFLKEMSYEELEQTFGSEFMKAVTYGPQNNSHHQYELFEHILRTVESIDESAKSEDLSQEDILKLKVAAFFHDVGKPAVATYNEAKKQTQYIKHAEVSCEVARPILEKLEYSPEEIEEIIFLIKNHDAFISFKTEEEIQEKGAKGTPLTQKNVAVVLSRINPNQAMTLSSFKKLLTICRADAMAQAEVVMDGEVELDSRARKLARFEAIEGLLPKALIAPLEDKIAELQRKIQSIETCPEPKIKNGKVVNQVQIDKWNAQTPEEREAQIEAIKAQIIEINYEEARLLEYPITLSEFGRPKEVN